MFLSGRWNIAEGQARQDRTGQSNSLFQPRSPRVPAERSLIFGMGELRFRGATFFGVQRGLEMDLKKAALATVIAGKAEMVEILQLIPMIIPILINFL